MGQKLIPFRDVSRRMANFGLTATSLFEIWTPAVQVAFTKEFYSFLIVDRMVLFLSYSGLFFFLFFFYQGLSSAFDFSISKELLRVNFVMRDVQGLI